MPNQTHGETPPETRLRGPTAANGPTLLTFQADRRIQELEAHEYRLDVDGGIPGGVSPNSFTASAKWYLDQEHTTPLAQAGTLRVLSPRALSRPVTAMGGRRVTPVKEGTRTLNPEKPGNREDIAEIVRSDLRRAIPDSDYAFQYANDVSSREPAWVADSGNYAAHQTYDCSVEVTADGLPLLHVEVGHEMRALATLDELPEFQPGGTPPNYRVSHAISVYSKEGTGTVTGWSEYRYTDRNPEFGDSVANIHEGTIDEALGAQLREENPRLLNVRYGDDLRVQVPHVLNVVPTKDQVKDDDPAFHSRFTSEQGLLPGARYRIAASFVDNLHQLPIFQANFTPRLSAHSFELELYRNQYEPRLLFADGNRSNTPRMALPNHGVYQSPGEYQIQVITPSTNPFDDIRSEFPPQLTRALATIGAPGHVNAGVRYTPGETADYTRAASTVDAETDVALAVVPGQESIAGLSIDDPFPELKRRLMRDGIPTQMMRADTVRSLIGTDAPPSQNTFANTLSALVAKAGGTPWRVDEMPGQTDVFLGLDVTRKNGQHAGASASVVLPDGATFAAESTTFQQGETFDAAAVERIVRDLVIDFSGVEHSINHLTIHRDGKVYEDVEAIRAGLSDVDVTFDIVSIRKSGQPRIGHYDADDGWRIADKGLAFVDADRDRAVLHSWGVPDCQPDNTNGTPRTIGLVKDPGPTDIKTLTEQAYWLSEIHYGSPSRSPREPVTIKYADKTADYVRDGFAEAGRVIDGPAYL